MTALGLGAAYLMRNKNTSNKLAEQFDNFAGAPMRGQKSDSHLETLLPPGVPAFSYILLGRFHRFF